MCLRSMAKSKFDSFELIELELKQDENWNQKPQKAKLQR